MSLSSFIGAVAQAYHETGHPLAQSLKPHLLHAAESAAFTQTSRVSALDQLNIALSAGDAHPIVREIADIEANMDWRTAEPMQLHPNTIDRHAYMVLVGSSGLARSDVISCGLYFQSAGTVYPSHFHAAEELYFVVSGTAQWQKGDEPFVPRAPGDLIHHLSMEPHAMTTLDAPLLAIWAWLGDLDPASYRLEGIPWD